MLILEQNKLYQVGKKYIYLKQKKTKSRLVPAVTLLFEGGEDSVRSVYNDLRRNIPVIIIQNTGRVADFFVRWLTRTQEMDVDLHWPKPVDIDTETISLNGTFKRCESGEGNVGRNRLQMKFEKYAQSMTEELVQAINGVGNDRLRQNVKTRNMKKLSPEILLMVFFCLQPGVRKKISVFNYNRGEKLTETILRSICKCKTFHFFKYSLVLFLFTFLAVEIKVQEKRASSYGHHLDYLLSLAIDWDCINTGKEWIVQDSLDNILDKKMIFCRALTKQRHQFVHYFIQLGLEIDRVFFDHTQHPFAARNYNKLHKRYQEFIRILYTEESIVMCSFVHFEA